MNRLQIARSIFKCQVQREGTHASFLGAGLRSSFGKSLKDQLDCHKKESECNTCDQHVYCPYTITFKPNLVRGLIVASPESGVKGTLPVPYAVDLTHYADISPYHNYSEGEQFTVTLTLFGDEATHNANLFTNTMRDTLNGFFVSPGFLQVYEIVDGLDPDNIVCKNGKARGYAIPRDWEDKQLAVDIDSLVLDFASPLSLEKKTGKKQQKQSEPEFQLVFERIVMRAKAIAQIYTGFGFVWPEEAITQAKSADTVSTFRHSFATSRSEKQPDASFIGKIEIHGETGLLLPYLVLGSFLHIGESATMGYGGYRVLAKAD